MATSVQQMPPIGRGYAYAFRLSVEDAGEVFPTGASYRVQVRDFPTAPVLAGSLTTENGGIIRVDDDTIEIRLTGEITGKLSNSVACLDVVRTDVFPEQYIGVGTQLPVIDPVTHPVAA